MCIYVYIHSCQPHLDKCSPFKYIRIITNKLNIWISNFLPLHLLVFLKQSCS
ncbi:hypothetical protein HanRHA438_Chr06g0276061 [Helianthus annuus]|nr:hypothetical protein HanRHA438_Chr06g0276061 [Helianthus annuus]